MGNWLSLEEKVEDIYRLYTSGLYMSRLFIKYIRIPLTEQATLRELDEVTLRKVYHYCSSDERCKNREAKTVEEHVVPIKTIVEILTDQYINRKESFNHDFIRRVLEKCLWVVFITDDENKRLNSLGLKKTMPNGWKWETDSSFIRYDIAKIKVSR
jgi:hypothetical protein